ncbi:MAG: 50S ribosomal protein L18 [Deltaproteobacteria bacterium]
MLKEISRPRRHLRKARVRKKVQGTEGRPRLTIFRSSRHIYAQVISDDAASHTLASASTLSPELKDKLSGSGNRDAAREVGSLVAKKAIDAGIKQVVFDRNGFLYHGRIRILAEAAREAGLKF